MSRKITIKAFKYNPLSKISKPHFATYEIEETDGMTLFIALNVIREKFDPELSFDFVCRAGICGSCGMLVNGKPQLACRTLTKDYPDGDISKLEEKVEPEVAQEVFELDRCIECGICVASCGTAIMRKDFIGAVGINRIARFQIDALDKRSDEDFYELIGDDDGVFGCMTLLGCEDNCPKHLPLQSKIAYIRRKLAAQGKCGCGK